MAKRRTFITNELNGTERTIIDVAGMPVIIFRRTAEQLQALRSGRIGDLNDANSDNSVQPEWAKNWHRSLKPEIMVCVGGCTRDGCVVVKRAEFEPLLFCPCCGARYDLAGRAVTGPAMGNLRVPPYRYVDPTTIEFIETDMRPKQA